MLNDSELSGETFPKEETAADASNIAAAEQSVHSHATTPNVPKQGSNPPRPGALKAVSMPELLGMAIPPREYILEPVFQTQSINMVFAERGIGKTMLALNLACAMSTGTSFHKWEARKKSKVLYIDGEMAASDMQKRIAAIADTGRYPEFGDNLHLITPDFNRGAMPNIATEEGQRKVEEAIEANDVEVIIIDNISTLVQSGKENEAESWNEVQAWCLRLRSMGKTVIFVHHAGKGGNQRGTSKREDVMDTVIKLSRPQDYEASQGAAFVVELTKSRGIVGDGADGFAARMLSDATWEFTSLQDARLEEVRSLSEEGKTVREIAAITGIPRATVSRLQQTLKE